MKSIRIVVVDDHALFRSGLISLLNATSEFQVVGEASNGKEALDIVRRSTPDVVLVDVNMPILGGVETVTELRQGSEVHILMLTISKNDEMATSTSCGGLTRPGTLSPAREPTRSKRRCRRSAAC